MNVKGIVVRRLAEAELVKAKELLMNFDVKRVEEIVDLKLLPFKLLISNNEITGFYSQQTYSRWKLMSREPAWPDTKGMELSKIGIRGFFSDTDFLRGIAPIEKMGYKLYILPILPLDIIEAVKVGDGYDDSSHPTSWNRVKNACKHIYEMHPFDISYADSAGLHAWFFKDISLSQAIKIEEIILDIAPDSLDSDGIVLDENDAPSIAKYIVAHRKFTMWWERR